MRTTRYACILEQSLREWGVDFWVDRIGAQAGAVLKDEILNHMRDCDVLVRLCTAAASRSKWVHREMGMFLTYQTEQLRQASSAQAKLISVCFEGYDPDGLDQSYLYIDAKGKPNAAWLDAVRRALGKPMGAEVFPFNHDDEGYLWWLNEYPQGFVLHAYRQPTMVYNTLKKPQWQLHKPQCSHVSGTRPATQENPHTGSKYIKVCSLDRAALERHAQECKNPAAPFVANCQCLTAPAWQ